MVFRSVLMFKKGVCSKRVSGSVVLEAFSSRARFICTTVVQIGVALKCALAYVFVASCQALKFRVVGINFGTRFICEDWTGGRSKNTHTNDPEPLSGPGTPSTCCHVVSYHITCTCRIAFLAQRELLRCYVPRYIRGVPVASYTTFPSLWRSMTALLLLFLTQAHRFTALRCCCGIFAPAGNRSADRAVGAGFAFCRDTC